MFQWIARSRKAKTALVQDIRRKKACIYMLKNVWLSRFLCSLSSFFSCRVLAAAPPRPVLGGRQVSFTYSFTRRIEDFCGRKGPIYQQCKCLLFLRNAVVEDSNTYTFTCFIHKLLISTCKLLINFVFLFLFEADGSNAAEDTY